MALTLQWFVRVFLCFLAGICTMIGAVGVSAIDQQSTAIQSRDLSNVNNIVPAHSNSNVVRFSIRYSRHQLLNFAVPKNAVLPDVLLTSLRRLQLLRCRRGCHSGARKQRSRTTPCNIPVICGRRTNCRRTRYDERTTVLKRPVVSPQLPASPSVVTSSTPELCRRTMQYSFYQVNWTPLMGTSLL